MQVDTSLSCPTSNSSSAPGFTHYPDYSRLQKSCNKQAEKPQLCLNREVGLAEAGKIIRFIRGKSIVVFHCSAGFVTRLLQSAVHFYFLPLCLHPSGLVLSPLVPESANTNSLAFNHSILMPFGPVSDFPFIHRVVHWLVTLLRCAPFVRSCNRPLPALVAWCILEFIMHTYWFGTTDSPGVQLLHSYGITWSLVDETCFPPPSSLCHW